MKETTLDGLIPVTSYSITVRAYQDILGPSSTSLNVITANDSTSECIIISKYISFSALLIFCSISCYYFNSKWCRHCHNYYNSGD